MKRSAQHLQLYRGSGKVRSCNWRTTVPWACSLWFWSGSGFSVHTACPRVSACRGRGSPGFGRQRSPEPQGAVWMPHESPFFNAQAKQQLQPGSLRTSSQPASTAGHSVSRSGEHGAQRMGSCPTTGEAWSPGAERSALNAATHTNFRSGTLIPKQRSE